MSDEQEMKGSQGSKRSGAGRGGPASGVPARRYSWPPFEPGNTVGLRHGAYAVLQLGPRAATIADWIRSLAKHLTPADEPALQTLALTLAQLERATGVLGEVDEAIARGDNLDVYLGRIESRARLSADSRGWANTARKFMDDLGLTPVGRAALEERTLTVIHVHEVEAAFRTWYAIAGRYVDRVQWSTFAEEVEEALRTQEAIGIRELDPGSESQNLGAQEKP